MIKRSRVFWLGIALLPAVAFAVGLYVGGIVVIDRFFKWESAAKASVLTAELRALRAGNVETIIKMKEIEVDGRVIEALEYQESRMPWLFWPFFPSYDQASSLKRVAHYRKQYPPMAPTIAPPEGADDPSDLRGFAGDVSRATESLIRRYGD